MENPQDTLNNLQQDVRRLNNTVFGNPDNMKLQPGMMVEFSRLEATMAEAVKAISEMRSDVRRVAWVIVLAVLGAILGMVLKSGPPYL